MSLSHRHRIAFLTPLILTALLARGAAAQTSSPATPTPTPTPASDTDADADADASASGSADGFAQRADG